MAYYMFTSRRRDKKSWKWMEFSLWFGIFIYLAFLYFTIFQGKDSTLILKDQRFIALSLFLFLVLVYFPTKKSIRMQKQASTIIETDRKGLHYKDYNADLKLAWRDIKKSRVEIDAHPSMGPHPKEFRLTHSKGTIALSNDPFVDQLEGALDLLVESSDKLPGLTQSFISFRNYCPYCGADKKGSEKKCSCGREVVYVNKFRKPLTLIKDELMMMILATCLLGTTFFLAGLALLVLFIFLPYLLTAQKKMKTLNDYLKEKKAPVESSEETPAAGST